MENVQTVRPCVFIILLCLEIAPETDDWKERKCLVNKIAKFIFFFCKACNTIEIDFLIEPGNSLSPKITSNLVFCLTKSIAFLDESFFFLLMKNIILLPGANIPFKKREEIAEEAYLKRIKATKSTEFHPY